MDIILKFEVLFLNIDYMRLISISAIVSWFNLNIFKNEGKIGFRVLLMVHTPVG